ncbi:MAG: Ig-like domain-containing protein [Clostridia bacterium]|nr:Ig-like domain-containing protein [Clostridia bacterium]
MKKFFSFMIILVVLLTSAMLCACAADEFTAEQVTEMLEEIDTLQQMQDKRSTFTAKNHYDINTTNASTIAKHKAAREGYESYVSEMFAKREAAKNAYGTLSDEQKAGIDPLLVAKLNDELSTVFQTGEFSVSPRDDEYSFEAVRVGTGFGYEVSNHMVSGSIPQTFILVDTSDGATTWTPSGEYIYGESNYEVVYCCDKETGVAYGTDYRRINLEDSNYFDASEAQHIRAILENSYPFVTMDEMKDRLKATGLEAEFVDTLTRADLIAAVQMAVWSYANINDAAADGLEYFASIDVPKNTGIYFNPLHDYTNEIWDWLPGKRQRSFDHKAAYRVNTLAEHLYKLKAEEAENDQLIISDLEVVKTELIDENNGLYHITMYISLNGGGNEKDELEIHTESYSENEDGSINLTEKSECKAELNGDVYTITTHAKDGDIIEITVDGKQMLSKGAYFYDSGNREDSQSMVGISEGMTSVRANKKTLFIAELAKVPVQDIELRETELSLQAGETVQLAVTVKPENATNKELIFSSDDESVATVDEKGNIVAAGEGTAVITVISADNPSVKKEITVTVKAVPAEPVIPVKPDVPRKHHVCFGKTDGIGWYEVSVNGGDFFPQGPNSTLEVYEGSILVVRVQDLWIDDEFDFYVNGKKVPLDPANTITVVVDGYMLIGALSMDVEVPDVDEALNLFQIIMKALKDFWDWFIGLFE